MYNPIMLLTPKSRGKIYIDAILTNTPSKPFVEQIIKALCKSLVSRRVVPLLHLYKKKNNKIVMTVKETISLDGTPFYKYKFCSCSFTSDIYSKQYFQF